MPFISQLRLKQDSPWVTPVSLVLFNLTWLSLVILRQDGILIGCALIVATALILPITGRQLLVSALIAVIGIITDGVLTLAGLISFGSTFLPLWLIVLWAGFSLVMHYGFTFLRRFPVVLQALAGALGGSSSYYAGTVVGSAVFPLPVALTLLIFGLVWALLFPFFFHLAVSRRTDGMTGY